MATLSPPPDPKQTDRLAQWLFALWKYVTSGGSSSSAIAEQVFGRRAEVSTRFENDKESILANRIFGDY